MSIEPVAAAAQACSTRTSNLLANWKCSFTVAHPSTVQAGGGPSLHSTSPVVIFIIGALIGLVLITMRKSRGRSAPASR